MGAGRTGTLFHPGPITAPGFHGLGQGVALVSLDAIALQSDRALVAEPAQRLQEGQHIKRPAAKWLDVMIPSGLVVKLVRAIDRDRPEPRHGDRKSTRLNSSHLG